MTNPYAPPQATVQDVEDPSAAMLTADRGTRLAASILDTFIFGVMVYLPFVAGIAVGAAATAAEGAPSMNLPMGIGLGVGSLGLIVWSWFTIRYMKRNGQSIAKKLVSIKVVRSDGSPVSLARLIWLRNVVNWLISIVPVYGIVDALFIFGESRQCLHDKIADTIVVKA